MDDILWHYAYVGRIVLEIGSIKVRLYCKFERLLSGLKCKIKLEDLEISRAVQKLRFIWPWEWGQPIRPTFRIEQSRDLDNVRLCKRRSVFGDIRSSPQHNIIQHNQHEQVKFRLYGHQMSDEWHK